MLCILIRMKDLYLEVSPFHDGRPYKRGGWREVPEIIHDEHQIKGFFGEYRWLSNFHTADVALDGLLYDSVERAYQAAKWERQDRKYFLYCADEEAITYNRTATPNKYSAAEWDAVKLDVMRFLLEQKFSPEMNPELLERLVNTGDRYLEEANWWNDTFWGKNLEGEGENNLGKLLMKIRSEVITK